MIVAPESFERIGCSFEYVLETPRLSFLARQQPAEERTRLQGDWAGERPKIAIDKKEIKAFRRAQPRLIAVLNSIPPSSYWDFD